MRLALKSLLKSGRVRRRRADPTLLQGGGVGVQLALRMLLLRTLQVEGESSR